MMFPYSSIGHLTQVDRSCELTKTCSVKLLFCCFLFGWLRYSVVSDTFYGNPYFTEEKAKAAAEQLKEALYGTEIDEDKIIDCLAVVDNCQRQRIAKAFDAAMGKPLDEVIKDKLSGEFKELVLAMLRKPRELDAVTLHDAIAGHMDEVMLIVIFMTSTKEELEEIKEYYKKLFDSELIDDIGSDRCGYFCRWMPSLCSGLRQVELVDDNFIEEQAQKLIDEGGIRQLGTENCSVNQVLCTSSFSTLSEIMNMYRSKSGGVELWDEIDSQLSSEFAEGYNTILHVARDKASFFASKLYKDTIAGTGTADNELIWIVVSRSEIDLMDIAETYEENYDRSLFAAVNNKFSGAYKRMLVCLITGVLMP